MKTVCELNMCNGCMACVEKCHRNAITIKDDLKYYNALIDTKKCVDCGLCTKVCPRENDNDMSKPKWWYQGWADSEIREYASSGGAASAIIRTFIKNGGYVASCLRPSCYECPYATTERKTDMTIGDFWHIEETIPDFYDEKGNSIFLIHTDRGEQLFETVKVKLEYRLSDTKQCWQANLEAPTKRSEQRDEFWNDYQRKGVDFVMKKYGTTPLKTKIKNKIVKLISIGGGQTLNPDLIYYVDYSERRAA